MTAFFSTSAPNSLATRDCVLPRKRRRPSSSLRRATKDAAVGLLLASICGTVVAQELPTEYGIDVPIGQTRQETRFDCWNVTNNSPTGAEVYVPLNMRDEWDGTYGIKTRPPTGVTFAPCSGKTTPLPPGGASPGDTGSAGGTATLPIGTIVVSSPVSTDPSPTPIVSQPIGYAPESPCDGRTSSCNGGGESYTTTDQDNGFNHVGSVDANGNASATGSFNSVSNPSTPTNSTATGDPTTGGTPSTPDGGGPSSPDGGDQ